MHGLDLTDALGHDPVATPAGVAMTATIFDELLARMTVPGRPVGLTDDLAWVRAASGRTAHPTHGSLSSDELRDPLLADPVGAASIMARDHVQRSLGGFFLATSGQIVSSPQRSAWRGVSYSGEQIGSGDPPPVAVKRGQTP